MKLLIIVSVKEVIYFKRNPYKRVTISDFKMYFLKNLNITKSHKRTINDWKFFDQKWKVIIDIIRSDHITWNSWYILWKEKINEGVIYYINQKHRMLCLFFVKRLNFGSTVIFLMIYCDWIIAMKREKYKSCCTHVCTLN